MRTRVVGAVGVLASLASAAVAQEGEHDAERAAWRYRREVAVERGGATPAFAALAVPPEVGALCQGELQDLRLVAPDGTEVAYVVDRAAERLVTASYSGRLVDTRKEHKVATDWVVDLAEARVFDRVSLDIPDHDFAKRVDLEISPDGVTWRQARRDVGVFDRMWKERIHHTAIDLSEPVTARYVRVTAIDWRSPEVQVRGMTASVARRVAGEESRRPLELGPVVRSKGRSRYRVGIPRGFPVERIAVDSDDVAFSRRVALVEVHEVQGTREETRLGEGLIYRLKIEGEGLSGESLEFTARRPGGGDIYLETEDAESPPLVRPRLTAVSSVTRLLIPAREPGLTLYYGNEATRRPVYDLAPLQARIALAVSFATATLGPEAPNPRFQKAPPLPFSAPRGARVDIARWRLVKALTLAAGDDLYALTLVAGDVGALRPDIGDLRIVDDEGRQIPYVLARAAAEGRFVLAATPEAERRQHTSRYRLTAEVLGKPVRLPLVAVELGIREGLFVRPVHLLEEAQSGRAGERSVFDGVLRREESVPGATSSRPEILPLDGQARGDLILEVEEGDNVPLTVESAWGVVRVPRVAFKAGPGTYRLLMGNPDAVPPQYDIAALRNEVLAYSALPVTARASEPNPVYRRRLTEIVDAPPTAVLWVVIGGAVVLLLFLTVRVLRTPKEAEPASGGTGPESGAAG